jgi:hypothetical protein
MNRLPTRLLLVATIGLIIALLSTSTMIAWNLRQETLRGAERDLDRHNLTLAGQAERSFQSIELILSNVSDHLSSRGVFNSASLDVVMADADTYQFLKEKLAGLPQIEAITLINAQGKLINFSRYWPIPDINVSDRDYFVELNKGDSPARFIGKPVHNRGTGTWNIYIARRITGINGEFSGTILAAISLEYFEKFYQSISLGEGSSQSLLRDDGVLLAIYPSIREIGEKFKSGLDWVSVNPERTLITELSPADGKWKIKAARKLTSVPLIIMTVPTFDSALAPWLRTVHLMIAFNLGLVILILLAVGSIIRIWRQQNLLVAARTERSDAEKKNPYWKPSFCDNGNAMLARQTAQNQAFWRL